MAGEIEFQIININNKDICIRGVGRLFYQEGFPVSMSIIEFKKKNVEVSMLHVASECMNNGWSGKTTYNKLLADFEEDISDNKFDLESLYKFCFSEYEDQREMLFQYLFNSSSNEIINTKPVEWFDLYFMEELKQGEPKDFNNTDDLISYLNLI